MAQHGEEHGLQTCRLKWQDLELKVAQGTPGDPWVTLPLDR